MSDITATVDAYLAIWNETDAERRARLVERAWTPGGHYVDPLAEVTGDRALSDMVATVQAQFPGHRFRRSGGIDSHHDRVRFGWKLVGPDGRTVVATGLDIGVLAPDGRFAQVTGFLGDIPEELPT